MGTKHTSQAPQPFVLDPAFVPPTYGRESFFSVPGAIPGLLRRETPNPLGEALHAAFGSPFDTVLLILVDGFGWRFFQQYAGYPALRRFSEAGVAGKLSSQFPSTTAAHLTTLHTGLEVGRHGVFEWQYYEPQLEAVIAPMMFSYAGTRARDELKAQHADPRTLMPTGTIYQELAALGIRSTIFQHREYTPSTYSDILFDRAAVHSYATFPEVLTNLRASLEERGGPRYLVAYFDKIDFICHHYGPGSPQLEAEIDLFLVALERQLVAKLGPRGRTLLMVTADHGAMETDPRTTIYLNRDAQFSGIERFLRRNRQGALLVPAGSPRDFFLYVHDDLLDEAQAFLSERLLGTAQVARVADLIAAGFFGPQPPSQTFLNRVGNLVILPYAGQSVWWYENDRHEQRFFGHHGGLTPQEMEIPLLAMLI